MEEAALAAAMDSGGGGDGEVACDGREGGGAEDNGKVGGGNEGGSVGGGREGGGGATRSGTPTPTATLTGAAPTTGTPRLAERAERG